MSGRHDDDDDVQVVTNRITFHRDSFMRRKPIRIQASGWVEVIFHFHSEEREREQERILVISGTRGASSGKGDDMDRLVLYFSQNFEHTLMDIRTSMYWSSFVHVKLTAHRKDFCRMMLTSWNAYAKSALKRIIHEREELLSVGRELRSETADVSE